MHNNLAIVRSAWENFMSDGCVKAAIRPVVLASWKRSREQQAPVQSARTKVLDVHTTRALSERNAELLQAAEPVIAHARKWLPGTGSMLLLTDMQGTVLRVTGDNRAIGQGEEIGLERGGRWRERDIGTNAIGTALAVNAPVRIHAFEHFCQPIQPWSCAAAPIRDPWSGEPLGIVDISSFATRANEQSLAYATMLAQRIHGELNQWRDEQHRRLLQHLLARAASWQGHDVIVFDRRGQVIHHPDGRGLEDTPLKPLLDARGSLSLLAKTPSPEWEEALHAAWPEGRWETVRSGNEWIGAWLMLPRTHGSSAAAPGVGSLADPVAGRATVAGASAVALEGGPLAADVKGAVGVAGAEMPQGRRGGAVMPDAPDGGAYGGESGPIVGNPETGVQPWPVPEAGPGHMMSDGGSPDAGPGPMVQDGGSPDAAAGHGRKEKGVFGRIAGAQAQVRPAAAVIIPEEESPEVRRAFASIIGQSRALREAVAMTMQVACHDLPVLLEGETGSGKEMFAQAIHAASGRKGALVPINCGALPSELIGSELFGYERGSFTGASPTGHAGKFEAADRGTLCLDEIGELPLNLQPYLLRVLEDQKVYRLGSHRSRPVDVRLIAMTNRNLEDEIQTGRFRQDLFFRIAVARVFIPPLRERAEDIPALVVHFAGQAAGKYRRAVPAFTRAAMDCLARFAWPGNLRQLRNMMERLVAVGDGGWVDIDDLPAELRAGSPGCMADRALPVHGPSMPLPPDRTAVRGEMRVPDGPPGNLKAMELQAMQRMISLCRGNMSEAARRLGIARSTLYSRLQKAG